MPFDGLTGHQQRIIAQSQDRFDWKSHFNYTKGVLTLDDAESIFFQRELEHIIPELFEFQYAKINARSLFPIDRSAGGAVKTITWRQFTKFGQAQIIADYADDINIVNAEGEEFTTNVRGLAAGAQWSLDEIRAAQRHGRPLERMYAEAAREAMLREENRVIFNGDAAFGLQGLASAGTGIPQNALPNGGWLTGATGLDMLADLNFCANTVVETTGDMEIPTRIILPTRFYNTAVVTHVNAAGGDTTVLKHFLDNNPYIREVVPVRELDTAFGGTGPVMMAYTPDPSKVRMQVPLDIEQFPPQQHNLVVRVLWHMRMGGLTIHKPASLHVCSGL